MALSTAQEIEINLKRNAMHVWRRHDQSKEANNEELQQLIAQAFVLNVAYKVNKNYVALRADTMTYVHPGSVFFREVELAQVKHSYSFYEHSSLTKLSYFIKGGCLPKHFKHFQDLCLTNHSY